MNKQNRLYSCKNEELLPISKFTLFSIKRDIADFTAFSNQFNEQYIAETEALITQVENVLEPQSETLAIKIINQSIEKSFVELQNLLLITDGYLKLSKKELGITPSAFGISGLRKKLYKGDTEGVLNGIKVFLSNLQNHVVLLEQKGMPATTLKTMQELHNTIAESKQKQYEIKTNRAALVQNNLQIFNDLYLRLSEIYTIGKVLYKNANPTKYNDYTFAKLLKKVRNVPSPTKEVLSPMS
jgi:hypothetical protein